MMGQLVNNELEIMWKEVLWPKLRLGGGTERNHESYGINEVLTGGFEIETFRIRNWRTAHLTMTIGSNRISVLQHGDSWLCGRCRNCMHIQCIEECFELKLSI
jgi:hypothetical protein